MLPADQPHCASFELKPVCVYALEPLTFQKPQTQLDRLFPLCWNSLTRGLIKKHIRGLCLPGR